MRNYITIIMTLVAALFFAACEEASVDKNNDGIDDNTGEVIDDDVDAGSGEVDGDVDGDADGDADADADQDPEEQAFQQLKAYCTPILASYLGEFSDSTTPGLVVVVEMDEDSMREKGTCVVYSKQTMHGFYEGMENPLVAYSSWDEILGHLYPTEDGFAEEDAENGYTVTYTRIQ